MPAGQYLVIPVELVHPDDKLCADVGLGVRDGLDANYFVRDVERATGTTIPDIEAQKLYTLRDILSFVSGLRATDRRTVSPESGRPVTGSRGSTPVDRPADR
jgi:hypothetical protein